MDYLDSMEQHQANCNILTFSSLENNTKERTTELVDHSIVRILMFDLILNNIISQTGYMIKKDDSQIDEQNVELRSPFRLSDTDFK